LRVDSNNDDYTRGGSGNNCHQELCSYADYASDISFGCSSKASNGMGSQDTNQDAKVGTMAWIEKSVSSERGALPPRNDISAFKDHLIDTVSGNTVKSAAELWGDDPSPAVQTLCPPMQTKRMGLLIQKAPSQQISPFNQSATSHTSGTLSVSRS